jgi:hypothetical protein
MNQTEKEIFYKLLIDLFVDQPGKATVVQQPKKRGTDESKTIARGRRKPVRKTNAQNT